MRKNIKKLTRYSTQEPLFASFLQKEGFYSQLLYAYVKNNSLERIANGVYKRPGGKLDKLLIIKSLQTQLGLPIHVSARSALLRRGLGHFGRNTDKLQIAIGKYRLIKWLKSLKGFDFIGLNIFKDAGLGLEKQDGVILSSRERAFIEMAELVPKKVSYEEFYKMLELAPNMRSAVLQRLLETCTSIKAKKVFLAAAEKLNYQWFAKLDLRKIKISNSILQLAKNGVYNRKYKIYLWSLNA